MKMVRSVLGLSLSLLAVTACGTPRAPLGASSPLATGPRTTQVKAKWVTKKRSEFIAGEIVVESRSGFGTKAIQAFSVGNQKLETIQQLRIEDKQLTLLEVPASQSPQAVINQLRQNPNVASATLNPRYTALQGYPVQRAPQQPVRYTRFNETGTPVNTAPQTGAPAVLSDAFYALQWSLPKIGIPTAWNQGGTGRKELLVAVVDSGIDYQHPDLRGQIVNGMDFMTDNPTGPNGEGSPDTIDKDPLDQMGHGTHVAGIIAALPDNQMGVAGIAPGVRILNIKTLNQDGWGSAFAIAQGITYAVDQGARIINLSLGGDQPSKPIELAVQYAIKKGALLVAASGNSYTTTGYPAAYPGVLAVGATDNQDGLADFSNHDKRINVVAPGVDILSTTPTFVTPTMMSNGIDQNYSVMSGTSMACPMVTAQAALLLSQNPSLTAPQIIDLIQRSARPVGDPNMMGHGLIQIGESLRLLSAGSQPAPVAAPGAVNAQRVVLRR
ncbi:MAG: S8 family peptidase [Candidatus Sericytochromatia bacterium]